MSSAPVVPKHPSHVVLLDSRALHCLGTDGLFTYKGSDEPDVAGRRPINNMYVNNLILDTSVGVKIKEADDTYIVGKYDLDGSSRQEDDCDDDCLDAWEEAFIVKASSMMSISWKENALTRLRTVCC